MLLSVALPEAAAAAPSSKSAQARKTRTPHDMPGLGGPARRWIKHQAPVVVVRIGSVLQLQVASRVINP